MMAYTMKENTGSLFPNDRKETDNHPDYKGQALIDGTEYWLSAWKKTAQNGNAYLSFSFKAKDARGDRDARLDNDVARAPLPAANLDDDVPF